MFHALEDLLLGNDAVVHASDGWCQFEHMVYVAAAAAAARHRYITNVINLFVLAPCQEANFNSTSSPSFKVPDGWSLLHLENYPPQGKQRVAIPAYAVLKSADGSQMAVIVRGTRTAAEWRAGGAASTGTLYS